MAFSGQRVRSGLQKKGFAARNRSHRVLRHVAQDGTHTTILTQVSHGPQGRDISDGILGMMARQCKLSGRQFRGLVNCPLSRKNTKIFFEEKAFSEVVLLSTPWWIGPIHLPPVDCIGCFRQRPRKGDVREILRWMMANFGRGAGARIRRYSHWGYRSARARSIHCRSQGTQRHGPRVVCPPRCCREGRRGWHLVVYRGLPVRSRRRSKCLACCVTRWTCLPPALGEHKGDRKANSDRNAHARQRMRTLPLPPFCEV